MNILAELKGTRRNYSKRLILTDDELIMEWDSPSKKGRKAWQLNYLSPTVSFTAERRTGFKEGVIGGIVLLVISVIIQFSKLNQYIPLLVPVMVMVAVGILINAARKYRIEKWTIFQKKDEGMAAYFEHSLTGESDIRSFEMAFVQRISESTSNKGS
jgi:hypothetical protein